MEPRFEYNEERMVNNFLELARLDSESGKEGSVSDWLEKWFTDRGISYVRDKAGWPWGSTGGNIVAHFEGTMEGEPIIFNAHQDTVKPGAGVVPVMKGRTITSQGDTILGADDKAGIAILLEILENIIEKKIPHREMYYLFSIGEEVGMNGVKNLDLSLIPCRNFFCLDYSGDIGLIRTGGPGSYKMRCDFTGRAAHAGGAPEKGISAIMMMAEALSAMPMGRIDSETTANIGLVGGGEANNVVPDKAWFTGEARSRNSEKLEKQVSLMRDACMKAAEKYGGKAEFTMDYTYPPINMDMNWFISRCTIDAYEKEGVKYYFAPAGGGGDFNILAAQGYQCGGMATGANNVHGVTEYLDIDGMGVCYRVVMRMMTDGYK